MISNDKDNVETVDSKDIESINKSHATDSEVVETTNSPSLIIATSTIITALFGLAAAIISIYPVIVDNALYIQPTATNIAIVEPTTTVEPTIPIILSCGTFIEDETFLQYPIGEYSLVFEDTAIPNNTTIDVLVTPIGSIFNPALRLLSGDTEIGYSNSTIAGQSENISVEYNRQSMKLEIFGVDAHVTGNINPSLDNLFLGAFQLSITCTLPNGTQIAVEQNSYPCEGTVATTTVATVLSVRSLPSIYSRVSQTIRVGEHVMVMGNTLNSERNWYQIFYEDGSGWISDQYIELKDECPSG